MEQQQAYDPLMGFNPMEREPSSNSGGGKRLPVSDSKGHLVVITGHETKALKTAANGSRMVFSLKIVEGPMQGKEAEHSENLGHVDETPRRIAEERVTAILRVCGLRTQVQNPHVDFYNKPFRMVVDYQDGHAPGMPDAKGYTEVTKILDFAGREPADPQAGIGGQQQQGQQQVMANPAAQQQQVQPFQGQANPQNQQQQVQQQMPQHAVQQTPPMNQQQLAQTQHAMQTAASAAPAGPTNFDPAGMQQQQMQQQMPQQQMQQQGQQFQGQPGAAQEMPSFLK